MGKIKTRYIVAIIGSVLLTFCLLYLSPLYKMTNQDSFRDKTPKGSSHKTVTSKTSTDNNQPTEPGQASMTSSPEPTGQTPRRQVATNLSSSLPTFKTESGKVFPLRTYKPLAANDPYASQWWTDSTGLETAWNIGAGSRQTVVAVIDTGFGLSHEEFANRWETNAGESGATVNQAESKLNCTDRFLSLNESCNLIDDDFDGIVDNEAGTTTIENPSQLNCTDRNIPLDKSCNQIDDDSNGYVDDVTGWDFANFDSNVQTGEINPNGTGTRHGTEVAGVLAATGNNGVGIAGVNWATKILPIQAIDDDGYGNTLTVTGAINYAVERKVDLISLSLGSDYEDEYLRQAIDNALDNGIVVVAASGNDGCDCISYPANYPEVVAVGSEGVDGNRSSFSSYGSTLDIVAPGEDIKTTTWTKTNQISAYVDGVAGTSFSTPYISGLLSLARSHQSDASWGELINGLLATANHTGLSVNNPTSLQIGSGYAMAGNFINRVSTPTNSIMRYNFGSTPIKGTLSSNRTYQCFLAGDFPTAPLYRIAAGSSIFYTIDTLESIRAIARGDSVRNLGRTCVGLPGDTSSMPRVINLLNELDNIPVQKS